MLTFPSILPPLRPQNFAHSDGKSTVFENDNASVSAAARRDLQECAQPVLKKKKPQETLPQLHTASKQPTIDPRDYSLGKVIGKGHFSSVAKITLNSNEEMQLVVKMSKGPKFNESIEHEASILKQLNKIDREERVIKWYAEFKVDGCAWSIIEQITEDLASYLKRHNPSLSSILTIMDQTSCAVAFLAENGFVHGDLKPENIGIKGTAKGRRICLLDFGLSFHTGALPPPYKSFGTLAYTAPEAICSAITTTPAEEKYIEFRNKQMTPNIDIWALGVIAAEMYSGQHFIDDKELPPIPEAPGTQNKVQHLFLQVLMVIAKNVEPIPATLFDQGHLFADRLSLREDYLNPQTPPKPLIRAAKKAKEELLSSGDFGLDYQIKQFIKDTLRVDPEMRLKDPLKHPLFHLKVVKPKP